MTPRGSPTSTAAHVGVIGGGALGLAAAYRLVKAGLRVTVLEKENVVGGLAASFQVGDSHLEKFYHHLFRSDRAITALIDEVGLGDRLVWKRAPTASLVGGMAYPMDIPGLLRFTPLAPPDRLRLILGMTYLKFIQRDYRGLEARTAEEWIVQWMGRRAYDVVWKPLFVQKFGDQADKVAMPWFWSRIYCRSLALGYLRGGFHQLYTALDERVRSHGGDVRTGQNVESIEAAANGAVRVVVNGAEMTFDRVICTLPTRLFMKVTRGLPEKYLRKYDWGGYNGAHCVVLALDRPLSTMYWLSIHDSGYPFLVVVEHTNYMPASDYGGQHLVYLGNYVPPNDARFKMSVGELLDWYTPHLGRVNPAFQRSWIKNAWSFGAPFAQPIVTVDYHQHIPPNETPVPGVFLANMFQVYPQDRGQNYSMAMAHRVADQVIEELARAQVKVG